MQVNRRKQMSANVAANVDSQLGPGEESRSVEPEVTRIVIFLKCPLSTSHGAERKVLRGRDRESLDDADSYDGKTSEHLERSLNEMRDETSMLRSSLRRAGALWYTTVSWSICCRPATLSHHPRFHRETPAQFCHRRSP